MMVIFSNTIFFFYKEALLLWSLPNMFRLFFASSETLNTATVKERKKELDKKNCCVF